MLKIASWASIWSRGASWLDAPWPWKAAKKISLRENTKALGLFWEVRFDSRRAILMRYRLLRWLKALRWEKNRFWRFLVRMCEDFQANTGSNFDGVIPSEVQWSIANSCHWVEVSAICCYLPRFIEDIKEQWICYSMFSSLIVHWKKPKNAE